MLTMMVMLYNWIWKKEYTPKRWREGAVLNSKVISERG